MLQWLSSNYAHYKAGTRQVCWRRRLLALLKRMGCTKRQSPAQGEPLSISYPGTVTSVDASQISSVTRVHGFSRFRGSGNRLERFGTGDLAEIPIDVNARGRARNTLEDLRCAVFASKKIFCLLRQLKRIAKFLRQHPTVADRCTVIEGLIEERRVTYWAKTAFPRDELIAGFRRSLRGVMSGISGVHFFPQRKLVFHLAGAAPSAKVRGKWQ